MKDEIKVTMNTSGLLNTLLFITFLVLKLVGVINWSWWWVTSPIWIPIAFILIIALIAFIWLTISEFKDRRRYK